MVSIWTVACGRAVLLYEPPPPPSVIPQAAAMLGPAEGGYLQTFISRLLCAEMFAEGQMSEEKKLFL